MAIIKNIVAKKSMALNTKIESKVLVAGEPMLVRFSSENELQLLLLLGTFEISTAPPPVEIKGPQVITSPVEEIAKVEAETQVPQPPAEDQETQIQAETEEISSKCDKCGEKMILTVDDKKPGVDILYCSKCGNERVVEKVSQIPPPEGEKKARIQSKCPICGKRKAKEAIYCKNCSQSGKTETASNQT